MRQQNDRTVDGLSNKNGETKIGVCLFQVALKDQTSFRDSTLYSFGSKPLSFCARRGPGKPVMHQGFQYLVVGILLLEWQSPFPVGSNPNGFLTPLLRYAALLTTDRFVRAFAFWPKLMRKGRRAIE